MWLGSPRAVVTMGMAEASVRGEGPGGKDEDLLVRLRPLVEEACAYYADGNFPAAMARMRVAQDLVDLRRGALVESVHRGRVAVCDQEGNVVEAVGDPESYVYARSSAKPFQALLLVLSGAANAL